MKNLVLVLLLVLLAGCSTVAPVTWAERVDNHKKVAPVDLHYQERGSGETLLLIHGFAESSYTWRYLVKELAKNYRVITLDLKGFGQSPKPKDGRYSIYDQAVAVRRFIRVHGLQDVTLVGHSLGGGVALAVALMAEKEPWVVKRLVLVDAAAFKQNLPSMLRDLNRPVIGRVGVYLISSYYQAREGYEYAFYNDRLIPEEGVKESAKNFSRAGSRYVFLQAARQLIPEDIEKISERYKHLKQPALIIWGREDVIIPKRYGYRLHRTLPNSKLVVLRRVGHMPQEESPKKMLSLLRSFLKNN